MRTTILGLTALLFAISSASPRSRRNDVLLGENTACSQILSLVKKAKATEPTSPLPTIPAQPAWECIQSVPLNKTAALDLVRSLRPFVRWQSTASYLAKPPIEYMRKVQPPFDIYAALDAVEDRLNSNLYTNEYNFAMDLHQSFQKAHDGHYTYVTDVLASVFTWVRPIALISVSSDGLKLPKPFVYSDILAASQGNRNFVPSAVKAINGQEAIAYLTNSSQAGGLHDRDALYNAMFYNLAQISLGSNGIGPGGFAGGSGGKLRYPGPTTDLEFFNGTRISIATKAKVWADFTGITSGEDLYRKYFAWPDLTVNLTAIGTNNTFGPDVQVHRFNPTFPKPMAPGYPPPVTREPHNTIGGYYIDAEGYKDVAVLSVASFVGEEEIEKPFQQTSQTFLARARADGKTKLIVDVSANGGGTVPQAYDLFSQLFPSNVPYAASDRFRATKTVRLIGEVFSQFAGRFPRDLNQSDMVLSVLSQPTNYRSDLIAQETPIKHFDSWQQKFGPKNHNGDNFTSNFRFDFNDPLITLYGGIDIHGYGPLANTSKVPPFAPENIVVVYDGFCSSTCAIFSELMRQIGGVSAVAMGGRPNTNNIQPVGGTKGTQVLSWNRIQSYVETAFEIATPEQHAVLLKSELMEYNTYLPLARAVFPPSVNFRDGIRKTDKSNTPLQFFYELADCRLFYTAEMTVDVTSIWKKVADVKWGSATCVAGPLNDAKAKQPVETASLASSTQVDLQHMNLPTGLVNSLMESLDVVSDPRRGTKPGRFIMHG